MIKLQSCFYKTKRRKLVNKNVESLRLQATELSEYGYLLCTFPFLFPSVGPFFRRLFRIFDLFSFRFVSHIS